MPDQARGGCRPHLHWQLMARRYRALQRAWPDLAQLKKLQPPQAPGPFCQLMARPDQALQVAVRSQSLQRLLLSRLAVDRGLPAQMCRFLPPAVSCRPPKAQLLWPQQEMRGKNVAPPPVCNRTHRHGMVGAAHACLSKHTKWHDQVLVIGKHRASTWGTADTGGSAGDGDDASAVQAAPVAAASCASVVL